MNKLIRLKELLNAFNGDLNEVKAPKEGNPRFQARKHPDGYSVWDTKIGKWCGLVCKSKKEASAQVTQAEDNVRKGYFK